MKKSEAVQIMGIMQAIWHQRELSKPTVSVYVDSILDLQTDQVLAALELLKLRSDWMPSIAEIRRTVADVTPGQTPPDADTAWAEVCANVQRIGSSRGMIDFATGKARQPAWTHPAIGQAVEALGWDSLCRSTNEIADRAHFFKLYDVTARRATEVHTMTARGRELMAKLSQLVITQGTDGDDAA